MNPTASGWGFLAQIATSTGLLLAAWQFVVYLIKRFTERRNNRAVTAKTEVETQQVSSTTKISESTDVRAWAEQFREDAAAARADAAAARADADASRKAAWAAQDEAASCRREAANLREQMEDRDEQVKNCSRSGCPLKSLV